MKNVQISLSDDIARDAAAAGLLTSEVLEAVLRDCLEQREKNGLMDHDLVCYATLASMPELSAIWNNPEDDVYNAL